MQENITAIQASFRETKKDLENERDAIKALSGKFTEFLGFQWQIYEPKPAPQAQP